MAGFFLTNDARSDLKAIGRYTKKHWGKEQKKKYLGPLDSYLHQLGQSPLKGRDCSDIRPGYRKFQVGSHVVFYRLEHDHITIVRILHMRMESELKF